MMDYVFNPPAVASLPIDGSESMFPVRRIYCVGRNYMSHIREMQESDGRDPPFFFQKPRDALVHTGGEVPYPNLTEDFQFEVELVVAMGQAGQALTPEQSWDHIWGYAVGLDMTRRDRQRESARKGLPWEIGKSFDASGPCGPLRPRAQVGDMTHGRIHITVNGQIKQDSDIEHMIWHVDEIVSNLSHHYRLEPGDLIYTGTPAGVAAVAPGDHLVAEIEGLMPLDIHITEKRR